jgi:hypothetical protein
VQAQAARLQLNVGRLLADGDLRGGGVVVVVVVPVAVAVVGGGAGV